jgi:sensor histidine kinase YesM
MNIRMQEDVHYEFEIDEEVSQNIIPKISIQPVVENALNHGLRNKHGEKTIKIIAKAQENDLWITVIDNGIGMDTKEMNEKLRKCDVDEVEAGNSIGLLNINARIKMLFGDEYGIQIESEPEHGTSVHLRIPQKKSEESK